MWADWGEKRRRAERDQTSCGTPVDSSLQISLPQTIHGSLFDLQRRGSWHQVVRLFEMFCWMRRGREQMLPTCTTFVSGVAATWWAPVSSCLTMCGIAFCFAPEYGDLLMFHQIFFSVSYRAISLSLPQWQGESLRTFFENWSFARDCRIARPASLRCVTFLFSSPMARLSRDKFITASEKKERKKTKQKKWRREKEWLPKHNSPASSRKLLVGKKKEEKNPLCLMLPSHPHSYAPKAREMTLHRPVMWFSWCVNMRF